jgi:hypothetical protein
MWRLRDPNEDAMPVPALRYFDGWVARTGDLETPNPVHLNGGHRHPALGATALQMLDERNAVQNERAWQVVGVDAPTFAGAVDTGRPRTEGVGHCAVKVSGR